MTFHLHRIPETICCFPWAASLDSPGRVQSMMAPIHSSTLGYDAVDRLKSVLCPTDVSSHKQRTEFAHAARQIGPRLLLPGGRPRVGLHSSSQRARERLALAVASTIF